MQSATSRLDHAAITTDPHLLGIGPNLGSRTSFLQASGFADIENVWDARGFYLCGSVKLAVSTDTGKAHARATTIHPAFVTTTAQLADLEVSKRLWVPLDDTRTAAVLELTIENPTSESRTATVGVDVRFPANPLTTHTRTPTYFERNRLFNITWDGSALSAEEQGGPGRWGAPGSNFHRAVAFTFDQRHDPQVWIGSPSRARLRFRCTVPAGQTIRHALAIATSTNAATARHTAASAAHDLTALRRTCSWLETATSSTVVDSPEPLIDQAAEWAKVQTLQVQHDYPLGSAFTNNPPNDTAVVRDISWYTLGNDYISPAFTRDMLHTVFTHGVESDGSATEFLRCAADAKAKTRDTDPEWAATTFLGTSGEHDQFPATLGSSKRLYHRDGYDLSVKDATPLLTIAAHHHAMTTGDRDYAKELLQPLAAALSAALDHRGAHGLVSSTSDNGPGTLNVWGLASWRNILDGFHITGEVTEINALMIWALRCYVGLLAWCGQDTEKWQERGTDLNHDLVKSCIDPDSDMFLLTIETDGRRRREISSDLVFPLLAQLDMPEGTRAAISSLLRGPSVVTPVGMRTIPDDAPEYDPDFGWGAMGGVWPNMSAWIAMATRKDDPSIVATTLRDIALPVLSTRPAALGNVTPGGFPEWFSGDVDTAVRSQGMAASPWMPPTYIWLIVEGLLGIDPSHSVIQVSPSLPIDWSWLVVRAVPLRGAEHTFAVIDGVLHTTADVRSPLPVIRHQRDVTDPNTYPSEVVAFSDNNVVTAFHLQPGPDAPAQHRSTLITGTRQPAPSTQR